MRKDKNSFIYKRNSFYHLYNRGNHKGKIFLREKDYEVFRSLMFRYLKKSHILLIEYCFMPNHYHFVLKCGRDETEIVKFMRSFMVAYVMYFNRKHNKVGHLFQGPFQVRRILGRKDLESTIAYVKKNPQEADLIGGEALENYRWLYIRESYKS